MLIHSFIRQLFSICCVLGAVTVTATHLSAPLFLIVNEQLIRGLQNDMRIKLDNTVDTMLKNNLNITIKSHLEHFFTQSKQISRSVHNSLLKSITDSCYSDTS